MTSVAAQRPGVAPRRARRADAVPVPLLVGRGARGRCSSLAVVCAKLHEAPADRPRPEADHAPRWCGRARSATRSCCRAKKSRLRRRWSRRRPRRCPPPSRRGRPCPRRWPDRRRRSRSRPARRRPTRRQKLLGAFNKMGKPRRPRTPRARRTGTRDGDSAKAEGERYYGGCARSHRFYDVSSTIPEAERIRLTAEVAVVIDRGRAARPAPGSPSRAGTICSTTRCWAR